MKPLRLVLLTGALVAVAACAPKREAAPQPQPQPPVRQPVQLPPPPPPAAEDWRDGALTPGGWSYSNQGTGSEALFGASGYEPSFAVRCDRSTRRVTLWRGAGAGANMMIVRTTSTSRTLPVTPGADQGASVSASLSATDPLLDAIAFSRGRFTVEAPGTQMLVIPAWPEPARVVEDCRG